MWWHPKHFMKSFRVWNAWHARFGHVSSLRHLTPHIGRVEQPELGGTLVSRNARPHFLTPHQHGYCLLCTSACILCHLLRLQQVASVLSLSCPPSTLSLVVMYIAPASSGNVSPSPIVEHIAPTQAVSYAEEFCESSSHVRRRLLVTKCGEQCSPVSLFVDTFHSC